MSDVFISYRREGGIDRAHLVYTILTHAGYDVFMDLHGIKDGEDFVKAFVKEVKNCKDYVLILSKNIFQDVREDDNVIKEIQIAISENKNIIILSPEKDFWADENLPIGLPDFDKRNYYYLNNDEQFKANLLSRNFTSKKKRAINYYSNRFNIGLEIKDCDIFEQDGIRVIHCMDDFENSPKIIRTESVFRQFLTRCWEKNIKIGQHIQEQLQDIENDGQYDFPKRKSIHYPIGTTLSFSLDDDNYRIVAFNHWNDEEDILPYTVDEYKTFLKRLWKNLKREGKNSTINITLMGNNFTTFAGDVLPNTEQKIWLILESVFDAARNGFKCNKLRICIYGNDIEEIKFSDLKTIIRYLDER